MKYKLMDGKQLAEYIIGTDFDKPVDFATEYPEDVNDVESVQQYVSDWYGIKKSKLFDSDVIVAGRWGGGNCEVFDIEDTTGYLPTELDKYIRNYIRDTSIDGIVCVEIK